MCGGETKVSLEGLWFSPLIQGKLADSQQLLTSLLVSAKGLHNVSTSNLSSKSILGALWVVYLYRSSDC